jgi:F420-0:gamma-glutamyl ligase
LQTAPGTITEVEYLPGATPDSSMVEIHLQSAGQSRLVRLAPVGFLKQSGLLLREGDSVSVTGFLVAGMEGDLLVATEIHKGEKALRLRDTRGRPAW